VSLPDVLQGVKGANWLTLLGPEAAAVVDSAGGLLLPEGIAVDRKARAVVIRAGERPDPGDRHSGRFPELYAAVERAILPAKVKEHGEFAGRFGDEEETMAWLNRLTDQERW
jgi:hypothetical protein